MSKKIDRATHGPSLSEVIFGALLSMILGVILGAGLLVLRPVITAKELPKAEDRVRGAVYYLEGSRDSTKGRQFAAKRTAFVRGQSVTVNEDELNALVGVAEAQKAADKNKVAAKGKKEEKGKEAPKAAAGDIIALGTPNVRIRDGAMQVAVPITVHALDLGLKLVAQARGGFEKNGEKFVYRPEELYLGSCPIGRLPFVASYVREKLIDADSIPDDLRGAWAKLASVAIDGSALKLTMP